MSFATLQQRVNATAVKRLGQVVTIAGSDGTPTMDVSAVFQNPVSDVDVGSVGGISAARPSILVNSVDVPPRVIDTYYKWCFDPDTATNLLATIGSTIYKIVGLTSDGNGLTVFELELT